MGGALSLEYATAEISRRAYQFMICFSLIEIASVSRISVPVTMKTVLVGMSGGVDSSVSAVLLLKKRYKVIGGFIKNWSDTKDAWTGECSWRGDRRDAMRVSAQLGIPLVTFDFEDLYREKVINRMFAEYAKGRTPNPDVLCNQEIKFGVFLEASKRLKADMIATGHYARRKVDKDGVAHLLRGVDSEKDQSYFLHRIRQQALQRTLFPVGDLHKSEVRAIAREYKLPTAERKESMGICFVGKLPMKDFLRSRIKTKPGDVVTLEGKRIGSHDGLDAVTIGQRHGFSVSASGGPWYAVSKDIKKNKLVVVQGHDHPALYSINAKVSGIHWIADVKGTLNGKRDISVAVRYRQDAVDAKILSANKQSISLEFEEPVFALAPGQSAVFYRKDECLGGGIIES
jgi:tRNA-specific 2-thiouridylase